MLDESKILDASILIVDDQEANVSLLRQMLDDDGDTNVASTMDSAEVCTLHRKHAYRLERRVLMQEFNRAGLAAAPAVALHPGADYPDRADCRLRSTSFR